MSVRLRGTSGDSNPTSPVEAMVLALLKFDDGHDALARRLSFVDDGEKDSRSIAIARIVMFIQRRGNGLKSHEILFKFCITIPFPL